MKVRRLRSRLSENVRVGLCTNTTFSYCQEILHALDTPLDEVFDDVFTSDYGLAKPQTAFWNDVESQFPVKSPIVLLDDSPLNIQGVQALKRDHWKSVLISDPESLYLFLEFLVSNNF
jgi:HAD superfamily hydrolase (TIGR01509 family)